MIALVVMYILSVVSAFISSYSCRRLPLIKSSRLFSSTSSHLPIGHEKVKYDFILEFKSSVAKNAKALNAAEVELNEVEDSINKVNTKIDKISVEIDGLTSNEAALLSKSDSNHRLQESIEKLINRRKRLEREKELLQMELVELKKNKGTLDEERIQLSYNKRELTSAPGKSQTYIC